MNILVDSDFLVAISKPDDYSHTRAKKLLHKLRNSRTNFYCLNCVVQESTTVISKKVGMKEARKFYSSLKNIIDRFIILDTTVENSAWDIFFRQSKKGTSFVDCANLAAFKRYKLDKIASFDRFYPVSTRLSFLWKKQAPG